MNPVTQFAKMRANREQRSETAARRRYVLQQIDKAELEAVRAIHKEEGMDSVGRYAEHHLPPGSVVRVARAPRPYAEPPRPSLLRRIMNFTMGMGEGC